LISFSIAVLVTLFFVIRYLRATASAKNRKPSARPAAQRSQPAIKPAPPVNV
jgi:hypothetical protein